MLTRRELLGAVPAVALAAIGLPKCLASEPSKPNRFVFGILFHDDQPRVTFGKAFDASDFERCIKAMDKLTGTVNGDRIRGYRAGELLFAGASGSCPDNGKFECRMEAIVLKRGESGEKYSHIFLNGEFSLESIERAMVLKPFRAIYRYPIG